MVEEYDFLFKCIVVGDGGVGKTALTIRFSQGFFAEDYKMTIGVDFKVKTITVYDPNGNPIRAKLQIWDTGGQERFASIRPMYYRGALGALLIFDLTSYESFEHLPRWIEEIRANTSTEIPLLLVGNKSDLEESRAVSPEEINEFTQKFNLFYMETSAKTGAGVGDCFYILACLMIGQGVPEKLIADNTVFKPGEITTVAAPRIPEADLSYAEPSFEEEFQEESLVPTPEKFDESPSLENESLVPEPFQEIPSEPPLSNMEAEPSNSPPAPPSMDESTPTFTKAPTESIMPTSSLTPPPTLPSPESKIEPYKESLAPAASGLKETSDFTPLPTLPKTSEGEKYKPKVIPFSPKTPTPVPPPKDFVRPVVEESPMEESKERTPFIIPPSKKTEETPSSSLPFMNRSVPVAEAPSESKERESPLEFASSKEISKKEKKKKAKKKKKEGKEKKMKEEIPEKPVFFDAIESTIKQKEVRKPDLSKPKSSLFETLTQKSESPIPEKPSFFQEISRQATTPKKEFKLEVIPSPEEPGLTPPPSPASSFPSMQERREKQPEDIVICSNCGAILSRDYMYCNKCGSKLG